MPVSAVRTTVAIPSDLLEAVDTAVREGKVRSRNEFLAEALRREIAAQRRAEIDAAFAAMADDEELQREAEQIAEEFVIAEWEAFQLAEAEAIRLAEEGE
jgi:metal-responsive CopG/Arc/MetJ family transcriptional regulator